MLLKIKSILASAGRGALRGAAAGLALLAVLRLMAAATGFSLFLPGLLQAVFVYLLGGLLLGGAIGLLLAGAEPIVLGIARKSGREVAWERVESAATLSLLVMSYAGLMTNLLAAGSQRPFQAGSSLATLIYIAAWVGIGVVVARFSEGERTLRGLLGFASSAAWMAAAAAACFWLLVAEGAMAKWDPSPALAGAAWLLGVPLVILASLGLEHVLRGLVRTVHLDRIPPAVVTLVVLLAALGAWVLAGGQHATGTGPSVVLVILDSVRGDAALATEKDKPVTPNLAALAAEGTAFTQASSASSWCLPATASLLTGSVPARHWADGASLAGMFAEGRKGAPDVKLLAESLTEAGWRTALFHSGPWLSSVSGLSAGFGEVHATGARLAHMFDPGRFYSVLQERSGQRVAASELSVNAASRWLASRRGPSFAVVHLMGAHFPYSAPPPYDTMFTGDLPRRPAVEAARRDPLPFCAGTEEMSAPEIELLRGTYLGSVASADEQLGKLIEGLRDADLLDETLVIVTSDHGENFGWGHLLGHFFALNEDLLNVPLVVRGPGVLPGRSVATPVSTLDVAPTILDACGLPSSGPALDGVSLEATLAGGEAPARGLPAQLSRPIFLVEARPELARAARPLDRSLVAWREGSWKLVVGSDGSTALYDLATDPDELLNLREDPESASKLDELRANLMAWDAALPDRGNFPEAGVAASRMLAVMAGYPPAAPGAVPPAPTMP